MSVFAGAYVSFLATTGSILNMVVLGTLWIRRRKLTPVEICIANISVAGLIPSLISLPMYASSSFAGQWLYGHVSCLMDGFIVYFFGMVSIGTLTCTAILRLVNTQRSCCGDRGKPLTKFHALIWVSLTYIYGAIWTVPPFFGWGKYGPEPLSVNCAIRWDDLSVSYFICVFTGGYVVPMILIICCYTKMSFIVQKAGAERISLRKNQANKLNTEKLLIKFGVLTCGTFFFIWTPYAVVSFLAFFKIEPLMTATVAIIPSVMAKTSVLVNPVIYFFMIKRFRKDASLWLSSFRMTSLAQQSTTEDVRTDNKELDQEAEEAEEVNLKEPDDVKI